MFYFEIPNRAQITAITGSAAKEAVAAGEVLKLRAEEVSSLKGGELEGAVATFRQEHQYVSAGAVSLV